MFVHSESVKSGNILLDMCVLQGFTVKRTTQISTYRLQPSVAKTNHYLSTALLTLVPSVHHRISMLIRTIQTKHHVCTTVSHHYLATFLFILHLSTCSAIITVRKVKHGEGRIHCRIPRLLCNIGALLCKNNQTGDTLLRSTL